MASRAISVPIGAGSEPELIEPDDAHEAMGDIIEFDAPCDKSPHGQCEYSMADGFKCCIHCGKESEF